MEMVNAKINDIDQIKGVVNVEPTKKTFMPQMENRKRYIEVQQAVSPIKEKGQKAVHLYHEGDLNEMINNKNIAVDPLPSKIIKSQQE